MATSELGKQWLQINGADVSRCKSDVVLTLTDKTDREVTVGISVKQCNTKKPTNAQLYFTTARGFAKLLNDNNIAVSEDAITALRRFCGDLGYRPSDIAKGPHRRLVDPRRWFWEELPKEARIELENTLTKYQDEVTRLLLQKAYLHDPFVPEYLVHKTHAAAAWDQIEVAVFSIDELVTLSRSFQSFVTRPYSVRKGSDKDPAGVEHLAPRFGFVQMQRAGQAQHPEQLQFNLQAGYFYQL